MDKGDIVKVQCGQVCGQVSEVIRVKEDMIKWKYEVAVFPLIYLQVFTIDDLTLVCKAENREDK